MVNMFCKWGFGREAPSGQIGFALAALCYWVVERRKIQQGTFFLHEPVILALPIL